MAHLPSFSINKETLGLVIACFSVAGTVFGVYNWMLSGRAENSPVIKELVIELGKQNVDKALKDHEQDQRLNRTDEDRAATKELTTETQKLKEAVVKLTTVIEGGQVTKKAEYISPFGRAEPITIGVR